MMEPKRWLDDQNAPREASELLRALRPPRPMPARKRAALAGVLAGLAVQSSRAASGMLWLKTAFIATAVVGATSTGYWLTHRSTAASINSKAGIASVATSEPVPAASNAEPVIPEAVPSPAIETTAPLAASEHRSVAPAPDRSAARGDTLAEEEALLEQARQELATSPAQALKLLHQHQQRFPHGELTAERLFLSIDAHVRLGDKAGAERQAKTLTGLFPNSAYARRVPSLLGSSKPAP
jgi:hypothetical protein